MTKKISKGYGKWHSQVKRNSQITLTVIDMQKFFLTDENSEWFAPKMISVVPNIEKLIKIIGTKNVIFTRFLPPKSWQDETGSWKTYFQINKKITRRYLDDNSLDIIDEFLPYIKNHSLIADRKKSASIFSDGNFKSKLARKNTKFLIFVGIETDYCVLASVLGAIQLGYFVIIVMDACASSKKNGQKHALGIFERFPEQLWITSTRNLIRKLQ